MKIFIVLLVAICVLPNKKRSTAQKIFDVHLHADRDIDIHLQTLENAFVYKAAISTSWNLQNTYRNQSKLDLLFGLMFPCPDGKVPYSLQPCFGNGAEWPDIEWVEAQIKSGKIDFLGEILNEYYGISPSDSLFYPYYTLAEKYGLPVGIHTGAAGPGHGSPNFKIEMGNPLLLEKAIQQFPEMKIWIMHSGDQYYQEAISIMKKYKQVYADISVISNSAIVPFPQFKIIMSAFLQAGLEDRIMFGSDNGNMEKIIASINKLDFVSDLQKDKLFYKNAEHFFMQEISH